MKDAIVIGMVRLFEHLNAHGDWYLWRLISITLGTVAAFLIVTTVMKRRPSNEPSRHLLDSAGEYDMDPDQYEYAGFKFRVVNGEVIEALPGQHRAAYKERHLRAAREKYKGDKAGRSPKGDGPYE